MKRTIITASVLAVALGGVGVASAEKPEGKGGGNGGGNSAEGSNGGYKVTGGGQIIGEEAQGAGDTVGFNAHRLEEGGPEARGQFQFVPRGQSGDSAGTEKFHGVVTCLISGAEAQANEDAEGDDNSEEALMPGSARFGGYLRDEPKQAFTVDVTDNGQGASNTKGDMILVRLTSEPCADNPEDEDMEAEEMLMLGRGNVKIHNNVDPASSPADNLRMSAAFAKLAR